MNHADLVALLKPGVQEQGGRWADLGAGEGAFTVALAELLGPAPVLESVRDMLRPGGRMIVVEYSTDHGNPWVPYPFTYATWVRMAEAAGLQGTEQLHSVPSRYFGSMYSALSLSPRGEGQGEGLRRPAT